MAQATTPDSQFQEDPSLSGEDATQGRPSLFGRLKNKTKDKTSKLKTKLKPGSKTSDEGAHEDNEDSSSSSSDDEAEKAPTHNAVSGVTQPEYEREAYHEAPDSEAQGTPSAPAESFPGNFAGIADGQTEGETKEDQSGLSKDFEGLSTNDNDESAAGTQSANEYSEGAPLTEKIKEKIPPSGGDSEQAYASPDNSLVSDEAQPAVGKASEAGKTWTQWAAEKVGYAKDTAAAKAPTTADGKPIHEEAYGAAVEKAAAARDSLASQVPDRSSIPSDPAQQSYVQKATGGIYGAKDKFFASTQPGDHDKALSQKVTESVGNLPATLKTSLGFGGKTGAASSPTTTPAPAGGAAVSEEASEGAPQSPGLVSRITGLFASKKPATDNCTASVPTISETGPETQTKVSEEADLS